MTRSGKQLPSKPSATKNQNQKSGRNLVVFHQPAKAQASFGRKKRWKFEDKGLPQKYDQQTKAAHAMRAEYCAA
jgi:hypothetical protein